VNISLINNISTDKDMWLFPFSITRFILLLLDCHHHDVRLCVQECVCVCLRELVQEDAFWSITSQQALAVIGVRAARLMSVAKASLSKPDFRQADQYNLCHLGASLSSFFLISISSSTICFTFPSTHFPLLDLNVTRKKTRTN